METLAALRSLFTAWLIVAVIGLAVVFPYHTEVHQTITFRPEALDQKFYDKTYATDERELKYVQIAREAAKAFHIEEAVQGFVKQYGLERAHVLDIGAGSGLLQDEVVDYTGLDISASARRYFHKPFVQADARAMPFPAGEFDAAWSIWVLEHVPNPEMALAEMRRVIKPNGLLFLYPAWLCSTLSAEGYRVRPYRDFGIKGKIIKSTAPVRDSALFHAFYLLPSRAVRRSSYAVLRQPTAFHYWPLVPNYDHYWEPDSDAVNSMDFYEGYLWFKSRGDICLNCGSEWDIFRDYAMPLVIRVKPTGSS